MGYCFTDILTIDDSNYRDHIAPVINGRVPGRGYRGMFKTYAARSVTKGFEDLAAETGVIEIPEAEWDDRIDQLERDGATLPQLCLDSNMEVLNQESTNFCWGNAPNWCAMVHRLKETGQEIRLSPASVCAPIKSFRNNGGWGSQWLEYARIHGCNLQSDWPANAISRDYFTEGNKQKALRNRILEYYKIDTWVQMGSCILQGLPTANGYNWWSHEVSGMHLTKVKHELDIANSWGVGYGTQGYGRLSGSKRFPNDCVVVCSIVAA